MADVIAGRGASGGCDDRCGCPNPCPGGTACRCPARETGAATAGGDHKTCTCGEHCGCNPCTCGRTMATGTGKANCRCGAGCVCVTCAA